MFWKRQFNIAQQSNMYSSVWEKLLFPKFLARWDLIKELKISQEKKKLLQFQGLNVVN